MRRDYIRAFALLKVLYLNCLKSLRRNGIVLTLQARRVSHAALEVLQVQTEAPLWQLAVHHNISDDLLGYELVVLFDAPHSIILSLLLILHQLLPPNFFFKHLPQIINQFLMTLNFIC